MAEAAGGASALESSQRRRQAIEAGEGHLKMQRKSAALEGGAERSHESSAGCRGGGGRAAHRGEARSGAGGRAAASKACQLINGIWRKLEAAMKNVAAK